MTQSISNEAIVGFAFGEGAINGLPEELHGQEAALIDAVREKRLPLIATAIGCQLLNQRESILANGGLENTTHQHRRKLYEIDAAFSKLQRIFGPYAGELTGELQTQVPVLTNTELAERAEASGIHKNTITKSLVWLARRYLDVANDQHSTTGKEVNFCIEFFDVKKDGSQAVDAEYLDLASLFNYVDEVNEAHLSGELSYADLGGRGYSEDTHRVLSYLAYTLRDRQDSPAA